MSVRLTWPTRAAVEEYVRASMSGHRLSDTCVTRWTPTRSGVHVRGLAGDNFEHLVALTAECRGRVDLAYLDPPYNGSYPLSTYDDTASAIGDLAWLKLALGPDARDLDQRERWLCLVYARLLVLSELLSPQGSLAVSIDSFEAHTLLMLVSELFGRTGMVWSFSWPHAEQPRTAAEVPIRMNYLLVTAPVSRDVTLPLAVLGSTLEARAELAADLGAAVQFETPKPQRLLRHLLHEHTTKHSLVLDPYAGSGSLGVAVIAANHRDGGQRRCICIERSADAVSLMTARLGRHIEWYQHHHKA